MASDTKRRILDAAESLMGDKGFNATSMRDITAAAKVNLASINYHFGSKEALLASVLERRLQPINEKRLELLDAIELESGSAGTNHHDIVRAFLSPPFKQQQEWGSNRETILRILGRIHSETNEEFRQVFMSEYELVFQRFSVALQRSLPHLTNSNLPWRMLFMVGSMAFTMSWGQSMMNSEASEIDTSVDVLEELVAFTCAGLAAPALSKDVSKSPQLQETQ
jgi:AcrR family transcriptional regulator